LEDARPPRFAQFVGFVCTTLALINFAPSVDVAGYGFTALAFGAAALNAIHGAVFGLQGLPADSPTATGPNLTTTNHTTSLRRKWRLGSH
jgi:hypothetical protein